MDILWCMLLGVLFAAVLAFVAGCDRLLPGR